jgi:hypothetical protein
MADSSGTCYQASHCTVMVSQILYLGLHTGKSLMVEGILFVPSTIVKCFDLNTSLDVWRPLLLPLLEYPPLTNASDQCVPSLLGMSGAQKGLFFYRAPYC